METSIFRLMWRGRSENLVILVRKGIFGTTSTAPNARVDVLCHFLSTSFVIRTVLGRFFLNKTVPWVQGAIADVQVAQTERSYSLGLARRAKSPRSMVLKVTLTVDVDRMITVVERLGTILRSGGTIDLM